MKYELIIWDWNGTLLNDVTTDFGIVNDMLKVRNMSPITIERYRECIGVPIIRFYEKVFDLENEDYEIIVKQYNDEYNKRLCDCTLSDGAREMLDYFDKTNVRQIIVSSSQNDMLKANVKKFGIEKYFDAILGANDFYAASKIDRAVKYIEDNDIKSSLVIGDLVHDFEMAQKLKSDCFLYSGGHEDYGRLTGTGAFIFDKFSEIKKKVN